MSPREALLGARCGSAMRGVALLGMLAGPLAGQSVQGRLTDAATGEAVSAALVLLETANGERAAGALSNDAGRFRIRAAPGSYRLVTEVLGYAPTRSPLFELGGASVVRNVQLTHRAIQLKGITATGDARCADVESTAETAALWDEARAALTAALWTESERALRYHMRTFERTLNPRTADVEEERVRAAGTVVDGSPYRSLPAVDLFRDGFVQGTPETGYQYFAPDARVILSDTFLRTYCFWVSDHPDDAGQVGLSFRPDEPRDVSEIEGTLWLDRSTAELQTLEFRHSPLPFGVRNRHQGGEVRFLRLDGGEWVVSDWWLRMPVLAERRGDERRRRADRIEVAELREEGASVVRIHLRDEGSIEVAEALADSLARLRARPGMERVADASAEQDAPGAPRLQVRRAPDSDADADGATVRGTVTGSRGEGPVSHALVTVFLPGVGPVGRTVADGEGRFAVELVAGVATTVQVEALGYEDRVWTAGPLDPGGWVAAVTMDARPVELEGVTARVDALNGATISLAGFGARARRGRGLFFTEADIERRRPSRMTQLMTGGAGVKLTRRTWLDMDIEFLGTGPPTGGSCPPAIWVDGILLRRSGVSRPLLNALVSPDDVVAVEAYRRVAETPVPFRLGGQTHCGSIVVWTRRGPSGGAPSG